MTKKSKNLISRATLDASHNGRELELMLRGKKPLAIFSKLSGDKFDVFDGQDFDFFVNSGKIKIGRFYTYNKNIKE